MIVQCPYCKYSCMNSIYSQLKFEHLQRFVTLAEEMHFGRAAQRLRIDQPTLSRSIRQLEQAVGQRLFERSTRAIALNAAGRVFLEEARRTLQQSQLAAQMAQRAALEDERTLRVALTPGVLFGKVFMDAITAFRAQWPRAKLEFDIVPSVVQ